MVDRADICGLEDYVCEECGFVYHELETARRCQDFCKTHNACSIQITAKAVHKTVPRRGKNMEV